jgi:hypothetical protein
MRAVTELCVVACILTSLAIGCRAADTVGPETTEREAALSEDPCYPNATPC